MKLESVVRGREKPYWTFENYPQEFKRRSRINHKQLNEEP